MFAQIKLQQPDLAVCTFGQDMPHMRFDDVSLV